MAFLLPQKQAKQAKQQTVASQRWGVTADVFIVAPVSLMRRPTFLMCAFDVSIWTHKWNKQRRSQKQGSAHQRCDLVYDESANISLSCLCCSEAAAAAAEPRDLGYDAGGCVT